jgi:hypothetical protein
MQAYKSYLIENIYIERERADSHLHFYSLERYDQRKRWDQTVNKEVWDEEAREELKRLELGDQKGSLWWGLIIVREWRGSNESTWGL